MLKVRIVKLRVNAILVVIAVCGCANQSNKRIAVTMLPSSSTNASRETVQTLAKSEGFFAGEQSAIRTQKRLMAVPECRDYMTYVMKVIASKSCYRDVTSSPHDTIIIARFNLHQDGHISDIVTSGNTNALVAAAIKQELIKCPPFPKWPDKMISTVGQECFEIYYRFGFNMTSPGPS